MTTLRKTLKSTLREPKTSPYLETPDTNKESLIKGLKTLEECYIIPVNEKKHDAVLIKKITRNSVEIINSNGFTPYEKKTQEILTKAYFIKIVPSNVLKKEGFQEELIKEKNFLKVKGITYLVNDKIEKVLEYIKRDI